MLYQLCWGWSSKLKDPNFELDGFDTIDLMGPIWAGNPNLALNAFLKNVNLKGKRVILGLVGANDENPKAAEKLSNIIKDKGGSKVEVSYLKGASLSSVEPLSENHVNTEAEKIISKL